MVKHSTPIDLEGSVDFASGPGDQGQGWRTRGPEQRKPADEEAKDAKHLRRKSILTGVAITIPTGIAGTISAVLDFTIGISARTNSLV